MKIISMSHHRNAHDFAMCIVNDDVARAHYAKCERANHQNLYSLAMFSPDSPAEMLAYIQGENDAHKKDMDNDHV